MLVGAFVYKRHRAAQLPVNLGDQMNVAIVGSETLSPATVVAPVVESITTVVNPMYDGPELQLQLSVVLDSGEDFVEI